MRKEKNQHMPQNVSTMNPSDKKVSVRPKEKNEVHSETGVGKSARRPSGIDLQVVTRLIKHFEKKP
jgi:hypothetical protein